MEIKSLRSSLVSILLKYLRPRYAVNNKNNVALIKLIIFTKADPIQELRFTPSESINSEFPKFDIISMTDPQLILNSL